MTDTSDDWEQRLEALWRSFDNHDEAAFRAKLDALAAERPAGDAIALFERAGAFDSTGMENEAAPLYRQALAAGLPGDRRRRAVIQLASTLRNLGQLEESVALLRAERERPSDAMDDCVAAFLALSLADSGREREALSLALTALARHLPRYNRSLANYAKDLIAPRG
jgi:hypothetical protein